MSFRSWVLELPRRSKGDQFTVPGRYGELERQVRQRLNDRDVPTLFVSAFDRRTRVGPFLFLDKTLIPGAAWRRFREHA